MSNAAAPVRHTDRFYIGGQWVAPSSDATIAVIDSDTEQVYFTVAEAQAADIDRAVSAAREAFDNGPWPWLTHAERAEYLRALGAGAEEAARADIGQIWPRESGVLHAIAQYGGPGADVTFTRSPSWPGRSRSRSRRRPVGGRVRPDRPGAGRRRRRDHPLERARSGLIGTRSPRPCSPGCTVILKCLAGGTRARRT